MKKSLLMSTLARGVDRVMSALTGSVAYQAEAIREAQKQAREKRRKELRLGQTGAKLRKKAAKGTIGLRWGAPFGQR